jgi:hypothetical protein
VEKKDEKNVRESAKLGSGSTTVPPTSGVEFLYERVTNAELIEVVLT